MRKVLLGAALALGVFAVGASVTAQDAQVARGRYLVHIAGCNDCHTAGYLMTGGNVPEAQWLLGDAMGWRGPWGTTYAANLRRYVRRFDEDGWVAAMRVIETRPPMPWFNLRAFTEADARAVYRYIHSLGEAGQDMPEYVPPDREPTTPFLLLVPQQPRR